MTATGLPIREHIAEFENTYYLGEIENRKRRIAETIEKAKRRKEEEYSYKMLTMQKKEEEE